MGKVYFDPETEKEIHDLSGEKSFEDIKKEYGISDLSKSIALGPEEASRIENRSLEKYSIREEFEKNIKEKAEKILGARLKIKDKLNLTDQDFEDLLTAIGR